MEDKYVAYIRIDFVEAVRQRMARIGAELLVGKPFPSYVKFVTVAIYKKHWIKLSVEERAYWFDGSLIEKD